MKKIFNKSDNLSRIFILLLFCFTCVNIIHFFYIKNSTYYLKLNVNKLSNDILSEKNILLIKKAEFNKRYNVHALQELAKDRLKLQFSNVRQIVSFDDILKK